MTSGISRMTAMLIKHGTVGETITLDVIGPIDGKYGWWISFWKDNRPHISPLLSAEPHYDTPEEARLSMEKVIEEIRALENIP